MIPIIVNEEHRKLAGICSLDEQCEYCTKAFGAYPLEICTILS